MKKEIGIISDPVSEGNSFDAMYMYKYLRRLYVNVNM